MAKIRTTHCDERQENQWQKINGMQNANVIKPIHCRYSFEPPSRTNGKLAPWFRWIKFSKMLVDFTTISQRNTDQFVNEVPQIGSPSWF